MTMFVISVIAVFGIVMVVDVWRAVAARRFDRQLRLIMLNDEDRLS